MSCFPYVMFCLDRPSAMCLQAGVQQLAHGAFLLPPVIHVPVSFPAADTELLENWLSERADRRVRIVVPAARREARAARPASRNAEVAYQARFNENVAAHYDASKPCAPCWRCPSMPRRIECFDISTIQGSETVASMVVVKTGG